ncbi:PAS domain S-box-containing protein/diguanylate cyclase (GGDEF) domain-containing protein [Pseudomonas sp. NFACC23-1]|uniref:EAL domain-containing protein n=1 Tax=unclassified Pseudomonas TaxID=196821 RepID=UPI00088F9525|nr:MULTISPECIES: EAL domain-containing protein [unclassified Pseudomonas]SDB07397.1 PAS domain S-box-containing protein/diguanylate cyclase (GGDEF) domain-containing protein [Pseudomonas sp. NFACC17-2]SEI95847.1 PAS domain S-box-containing protein/diguanylate cyclase (GGDEF) domain-containing protein [Pseudomonas sp. NFACC23-1]SFW33062.1 PAS domain S-box-containing protein/diguanylate cyclase (GGDEF) domain-containing protein [Pseudomonas sp. NFACC16-2]
MKQKQTLGTPRLLGIVWPFIAVVLFQALLGGVSLYVLSAVRGYVAGESLWSKGQKDAIYYLNLYADSRDEAIFRKYQQAIAVPEGGHELRVALDREPPDLEAARAGILKGGNHPDDVSSLIWLYLNFRHFSYLEEAIDLWTVGDGYLIELDNVARQMHNSITAGQASEVDIRGWKAQIFAINDSVTPAAKAFSDALGEGSRFILQLLLVTNFATALGLIVLALLRTHKLLAQRQVFANALQMEKERAQITLQSIGDGVITTDVEGAIAYMNPAAEAMTHWKAEHATGLPLAALFNLLDDNAQTEGLTLIEHILSGRLSAASEHSKLIQRLDGSTVSVTLVGAPIRHAGKVSGAVLVLHDMTQERQYIANLSWQATHDALTGLANRREFEYRLEQALHNLTRQVGRHALMFLDLDQFKLVNDTCGHAAGDELLRHICALLQSGLRENDTLARLGGDEFGILLENCSPEAAEKIAEGLRQTVQNLHFVWKGRPFVTTVSIGLVHIALTPTTLEASLRAADMACYMAKEKGRNRVQVYHADDSELSLRFGEMAWVQRLHMALEENRFCLYAQEIAALGPGEHGGGHIEILLRLHDEAGRMILPDSFIPAAERYGLMTSLDRWVVENVFKIIRQCLNESRQGPMAMCAINLSGTTIGDQAFLDFLRKQFAAYSIPPEMICFEITETSAISNLGSAIRFINELKSLGCYFSLDDFCAGMSSFAYLKHLPVDFLKIDGSFVKDMLDDPINRAMVEVINHIGHVMGKRTIAEFVETAQIEQALLEIGVDYAQGYVIERPQLFTCDTLQCRPARPQPLLFKAPGTFR